MRRSLVTLALALVTLAPTVAGAQPEPDFLFGRPGGMIGFRSGWLFASAKSDLFDFVQEHLTVDRNDFNAPAIGADLEIAVNNRSSIVAGFDFSQASKNSEYRDFVDNQRLPITQYNRLREMNLSGSFKFALVPRGREISSRAWVPSIASPYVGAGAGFLRYEFMQTGDFIDVDSPDLDIFSDTFRTSGWAPSAHLFGGVDVRVYKRLYVSGEGRYLWSNGELNCNATDGGSRRAGCDFSGFEPLDLAGFKATAGIHYLF